MSSTSNNTAHTAYIGLGSNIGERAANIDRALDLLMRSPRIEVTAVSRYRETVAIGAAGPSDQPPFINAAARIATSFAPGELLSELISIERSLGRPHPRPKGEPRTIDLDILFYDDLAFESADLIIPHPEVAKRLFVLAPLCDIDPALLHPEFKLTVCEMEQRCRIDYPSLRVESLRG